MHRLWSATCLLASCGLFSCAATVNPAQQSAQSQAAVRGAVEAGAEHNPQAALHLKMARDQIQQAEQFIAAEENEAALTALQRAEIDAELAVSIARKVRVEQDAALMRSKIAELRTEATVEGAVQ